MELDEKTLAINGSLRELESIVGVVAEARERAIWERSV
jgi:hypothetical protein